MLQVVQPGLIGLIDGTISTLAPIFAAAYLSGSRAALLVGIAAALGAAISMGLSEGLSDDGSMTGRGAGLRRGLITGGATFFGGSAHALPFLIGDVGTALTVAYVVVAVELCLIAYVRKRFQRVSLTRSLIQVTLGGVLVAGSVWSSAMPDTRAPRAPEFQEETGGNRGAGGRPAAIAPAARCRPVAPGAIPPPSGGAGRAGTAWRVDA